MVPALLVISTRARELDAVVVAVETVTDWMTSVAFEVWNVKVSDVVAEEPGGRFPPTGSFPIPSVTVVVPGAIGMPIGDTPVDQLPLVSWVNIL